MYVLLVTLLFSASLNAGEYFGFVQGSVGFTKPTDYNNDNRKNLISVGDDLVGAGNHNLNAGDIENGIGAEFGGGIAYEKFSYSLSYSFFKTNTAESVLSENGGPQIFKNEENFISHTAMVKGYYKALKKESIEIDGFIGVGYGYSRLKTMATLNTTNYVWPSELLVFNGAESKFAAWHPVYEIGASFKIPKYSLAIIPSYRIYDIGKMKEKKGSPAYTGENYKDADDKDFDFKLDGLFLSIAYLVTF